MGRYRISRLAQGDLEQIWEYTIREWSWSQADKYLDGLLACFDAIADGKAIGKSVDSLRMGYRKNLYGRHYVFSRVGDDDVVEIIRVLHVSMDIENRL